MESPDWNVVCIGAPTDGDRCHASTSIGRNRIVYTASITFYSRAHIYKFWSRSKVPLCVTGGMIQNILFGNKQLLEQNDKGGDWKEAPKGVVTCRF